MDHKEKKQWDNMLKMYAEMEDSILDLKEQLLDSKNQNDRELIESFLRQESELFDIAYKAVGNKAYVTRNKSKYRKKLMNQIEYEPEETLGLWYSFLASLWKHVLNLKEVLNY